MKDTIRDTLQFQDLSEEEKSKRGILGRLYGPCASIIIPTRNGRKYDEKLWDYQFSHNELLKEMIANGGIPMELDHPQDREETDSQKIAAMLPELPKKDKDGHLICYCDIIDTPCGRIAYQLAKYGFKLGISSRGTGDLITDMDGNEAVDPETYDLTTFDLVLIPAVKDARLTMVESIDKDMLNLKKALKESFDKSNEDEKKVMKTTLNDLGINIDTEEKLNSKKVIDEGVDATNGGANQIIKNLQEAIKENNRLNKEVHTLQGQLAVSNTKVEGLNKELLKYKTSMSRLTEMYNKASEEIKAKSLNESATSDLKKVLEEKNNEIASLESESNKLKEQLKNIQYEAKKSLREKLNASSDEVKKLQEDFNNQKGELEKKIEKLQEDLELSKNSSNGKIGLLEMKLSKSNNLVEGYKKLASDVVNKYIESKAILLGVSSKEIKDRLSESYTLEDIDSVCESLNSYVLTMNRLPFNIDNKSLKVKVRESKEPIKNYANTKSEFGSVDDDSIDEKLLNIAGLTTDINK